MCIYACLLCVYLRLHNSHSKCIYLSQYNNVSNGSVFHVLMYLNYAVWYHQQEANSLITWDICWGICWDIDNRSPLLWKTVHPLTRLMTIPQNTYTLPSTMTMLSMSGSFITCFMAFSKLLPPRCLNLTTHSLPSSMLNQIQHTMIWNL